MALCIFLSCAIPIHAQDHKKIEFCDYYCDSIPGGDSITLFLKIVDDKGEKVANTKLEDLNQFSFFEDGKEIKEMKTDYVRTGRRITNDYTFSVLIDLNIPQQSKEAVFEAVSNLVESAPDSCVYLSFFGDEVTSTKVVNKKNIEDFKKDFLNKTSKVKYFYGAVYAKLMEFSFYNLGREQFDNVNKEKGYVIDTTINKRAIREFSKNYLLIFTEGSRQPDSKGKFHYTDLTKFHRNPEITPKPIIHAFYYGDALSDEMKPTLQGLTTNTDIPERYRGKYFSSDNLDTVLSSFKDVVNDASYDYYLRYKATKGRVYQGTPVLYTAKQGQNEKGQRTFVIGSTEQPWPIRHINPWFKYLMAALISLLTIVFFFFIIKVLIPGIKSKAFAAKYYKKYVPEPDVQLRTCHYCRQPILPGQSIVTRCKHIMHVNCWQQNGYKCAEYGQNCKEGIQEHVNWSEMFHTGSLRDFYLTMEGILAGFVSWIIYDLFTKKPFTGFARTIVNTFLNNPELEKNKTIIGICTDKVASFLLIGLLLGFFMSIIFRYNDGARKNDWKSLLKLLGLSLLSGVIGMAAFLAGSIIFCWLLSFGANVNVNQWYYSFPAYLLFSVCASLSLTIKSTIPIKSALLGGICSAVIGFIVLYFSNFTNERFGWMNMFLNFAIYGGGLGASLVTVRMLAEKYYLVIKNGVRAGQRIPIHKWMNATGGGNMVTIGMTERCEIQMTWEKSNKVAKEHVQLYVDHSRSQAMLRPLATGVVFNNRTTLAAGKPVPLNNMDTFNVGDTIFQYVEN